MANAAIIIHGVLHDHPRCVHASHCYTHETANHIGHEVRGSLSGERLMRYAPGLMQKSAITIPCHLGGGLHHRMQTPYLGIVDRSCLLSTREIMGTHPSCFIV